MTSSNTAEQQDSTTERKTTLLLSEELWRRGKQIALDENTSLRQLLIEGLEMRLRQVKGANHA